MNLEFNCVSFGPLTMATRDAAVERPRRVPWTQGDWFDDHGCHVFAAKPASTVSLVFPGD